MKALSLLQPWASLIAIGAKRIETRSWSTKFRGTFAVHASKNIPGAVKTHVRGGIGPFWETLTDSGIHAWKDLPLGAIVAGADLAECLRVGDSYVEFGQFGTRIQKPNGQIVLQMPKIVDYRMPQPGSFEYAFGDYSAGRYMFFLENVRKLASPVPCNGALGFWELTPRGRGRSS